MNRRYLTMNTYSDHEKKLNVLVFDSGVGGLSVYNEIRQLLPNLNYIYAFDNEGFPYGEKAESFIIERDVKIVEMIEQEHALDLVVVACNTASTVVLPALRKRFKFPIVGVVPAIKPAVAMTKNGVVGLLATKATVSRAYTHELIKQFAADCKVELLGSSRLVELAEDKLHGKPIDPEELVEIFLPWTQLKTMPDTIVLGCTHFPLILDELKSVLPPKTAFIDSGAAIARRVATLIMNGNKSAATEGNNFAVCTRLDDSAKALLPTLKHYQLNGLLEFTL
jgi:glutamate racemase